MKKIIVKMTMVMVLFILLGTLSACTEKTEASTKGSAFISATEVTAEYEHTIATLSFPEGFPMETPTFEEADYQKGFGETMAYQTWQMAWEKEWLNTYETQPEKAKVALEQLDKALHYPYMGPEKCDDATRNFFKDALTKAKAGDPSGFAEDVKVNG